MALPEQIVVTWSGHSEYVAIVNGLCDVDPLYDFQACLFCGALPPRPDDDREWAQRGDDHRDDCVWWRARRINGLPSWPERAERKPAPKPPEYPFNVLVRPEDHPRGLSERQQALDMGYCRECGPDRFGHTYTALCWWSRRWRQKDAKW